MFGHNPTLQRKVKSTTPVKRLQFSIHKVVLLGDSGTVKTCLVNRAVSNTYSEDQRATIGADFKTYYASTNEVKLNLQLWDTAGQERYQSITDNYCRDAHACIIVVDLTNRETLKNVEKWKRKIEEINAESKNRIYLVGNKSDSKAANAITMNELNDYAQSQGFVGCSIVSAKTGDGVGELFISIVRDLMEEYPIKTIEKPVNPFPTVESEEEEVCCFRF